MIKSGSTAWQIIKPGVDLGLIDSIIITYKTLPGYGSRVLLQRQYPEDTREHGDELLLPLSQADTTLLREEGGDRVRLELQYNFSSGAVAKSEIKTVHIGDTLATAYVDGSNPDEAQIEGLALEFDAGDVIAVEADCVKDWDENNPESEKYIEGRTHYRVCVFHSEMNKPNTHDGWHQIKKPGEGVSLLIDGTDVPDYWWPRYTELSNVIAEAHGTFEAEIKLGFPEDSAYADRTMEYKIGPGNLKNAKYLTMLDDKNYTVNFIGTSTPYQLQIAIIVDTAALVEENKAVYPVRGIYFVCQGADSLPNGSYITIVRTGVFRYYPLDPNYIPSTIARTADVIARQQLAADAGKALVIGEDGVVKPGDAGGTVVVTTTYGENYSLIASHSASEIKALHDAGKAVLLKSGYTMCALKGVITTDGKSQADFYSVPNIPEDGSNNVTMTWFTVNDDKRVTGNYNGYSLKDMTGASADAAGKHGFVPAPAKGDQDKVLHGDGTWRESAGSLIVTITENDDGTFTPSHTSQEIYAAYMGGKSVTAVFDSYIFRLVGCFEDSALFVMTAVGEHNDVSQGQIIVAGNKATFEAHYISPMTPATAEADGAAGLVPAPAAGQQDMVLHGDGTWRDPNGWDVRYTLTLSEPLEGGFSITEIDGEPLQLREMYVIAKLVSGITDANQTMGCTITTDKKSYGGATANQAGQGTTGGFVLFRYHATVVDKGRCDCEMMSVTGGNAYTTATFSPKANQTNGVFHNSIFNNEVAVNYITGLSCTNNLAAGTEVLILGRKL